MTGSSLFAGALLLALVRQSSATWQRLEQLERLDGNETCSMEDASLLNIGTSRAHNGRSGSKCQYCLCLAPDPVKCGKKMIKNAEKCGKEFIPDEKECGKKWVTDTKTCGSDVVTSAEKCGKKKVTSIKECGESLKKVSHPPSKESFGRCRCHLQSFVCGQDMLETQNMLRSKILLESQQLLGS